MEIKLSFIVIKRHWRPISFTRISDVQQVRVQLYVLLDMIFLRVIQGPHFDNIMFDDHGSVIKEYLLFINGINKQMNIFSDFLSVWFLVNFANFINYTLHLEKTYLELGSVKNMFHFCQLFAIEIMIGIFVSIIL